MSPSRSLRFAAAFVSASIASHLFAPAALAGGLQATSSYSLNGPIGRDTAESFRKAVAEATPRIRWLVVDSPGGEVGAALDMANLMRREDISIYVHGYCASSCANYLFVSARLKVLGPNAVVGWHGSPASEHIDGLDTLSPLDRANAEVIRRRLVREERKLFAQVGVDPRLLCAGDRTIAKEGAFGWTMPIRAMTQFGVSSVISLAGDRNIPTVVPGHAEPLLVIEPRLDCQRTYSSIGPSPY